MSVITAYKCDATGKLFEDKAKYVKHIRKVAAERRITRKIDAVHKTEKQWWMDNFWNRVKSLEQLKAAILHHRDVFAANGIKNYRGSPKLLPTPIIEFTTLKLHYKDSVSNSHNCPHDGVTNWAGETKGAPRGYAGWTGRFDYDVQSHKNQLHSYPGSSEMWENTRIHTGTGGGGGHKDQEKNFKQSFGYVLYLFFSDWPAMAAEYEKAKTYTILKGDTCSLDQIVNDWHPADSFDFS
jgi:hypothetical protein